MALRTVNNTDTFSIWKQQYNLLVADIGDKALLTTDVTTSLVASLNDLQTQIDGIVVGAFSLANNTFFVGDAAGPGTINIFKVRTDDTIEFGADVKVINITGGTISNLTSPADITVGGTGAVDAPTARSNLGVAIGTHVQAWDTDLDAIAGLAAVQNDFIVRGASAWEKQTPAQVRSTLGLVVGTNVQAWDTHLDQIAALVPTNATFLVGNGSNWINADAAAARSILSLVVGTNVQAWDTNLDQIAALVPSSGAGIVGNGSAWTAATGSALHTALGLSIGTNVQAWDANLDQIAALAPSAADQFIVSSGAGVWALENASQARTSLGLVIGTNVQAWDANLDQIAALAPTTGGEFIIASGAGTWAMSTLAQTRTTLNVDIGVHVQAWDTHLDQIAALTPAANSIIMGSGGTTWVAVTPATARTNLGLEIGTNVQAWDADLDTIAGLSKTANNFIVANGSAWTVLSGASARSAMSAAKSETNADITAMTGVSDITPAGRLTMYAGSGAVLQLGWNGLNKLEGSSNDIYPILAASVNLGTSSLYFNGFNINRIAFRGSHGVSTKNPAVDAVTEWAEVVGPSGNARFVPLYAAS